MTALGDAIRDCATMFRRDLRHSLHYPAMTISGMLVPVIFLLLFAGVFGHTLTAGLSGGLDMVAPGATRYIDFLAPGILVMTAGFAAEATAVNVCTDFREGIIDRFRTMAISRGSVLSGQVMGSLLRTLLSAAVVVAIAVAMGFRSSATPLAWLGVAGVFAMLTVALTWLTMAFGLHAKTPAGANSLALLPAVLPFVSSAFVPPAAMPSGVRWFAQNEPFSPVIDTLRGLLTSTGIGDHAAVAAAWCAAIALAGYLWARSLYSRGPAR